ncbi:MAG TPA: serine/threonine-protein kinase [Candidatus Saccharimonadales bacterium]|nr:serine/threonine-protein kinase [Candidatus Saccharimonadales bacterium]
MPHPSEEKLVTDPAVAGRYERMVCLGRGASGIVYLARDRVIERTVALKVVEFGASLGDEARAELAARSEREARAAGALNHPNIVTIHDAGPGPDERSFFIVMEYVEGETLAHRLEEGALTPRETVRIGAEIADALEYAHQMGVVHRDVKPANILIRKDNVAKIADFGVARLVSSDLTQTGQWVGSPAYMSPEQAQGLPADSRSDIFALGVVIYEMLTGTRPFTAETLAGLSYQIIHEEPVPPTITNPDLDPRWNDLLARAMAKKPEDRFASASDLAGELEVIVPGIGGTMPSEPYRPSNPGLQVATRELEVESLGPAQTASRPVARFPWGRAAALLLVVACSAAFIVGMQSLQPAAAPTATLILEVDHGLDSGEIKVGVDGKSVWRQSMRATGEDAHLSGFSRWLKRRKTQGWTSGEIRIPAGEPEISVTVESGGERWTQTTTRRLAPGSTGVLDVRIRQGKTNTMELKWNH